jgi:hypothetical protein
MVLAFLPVWVVVVVRALGERPGPWERLRGRYPRFHGHLALFLVALLPGAVALLPYGSDGIRLGALGALGYVSPVFALLVGYAFARDGRDVRRLLAFYCAFSAVVLVGGALEYVRAFPESPLLGTRVLGTFWIRHVSWGYDIELMSGFYRSPDLMGWHAATTVMLSLALALDGRAGPRWLWATLAAWGSLLALLSGRNKMILMPVVWGAVVALAALRSGRGANVVRLGAVAGAAVLAALLATGHVPLEADYVYNARVASEGVLERLDKETTVSLLSTLRQSGFWGDGLGIASQGRQHLGLEVRGGWQESGLSKLLVELGVPGFLAALLLAGSTAVALRRGAVGRSAHEKDAALQVSLYAFLAANAACFVVSHHAFSDGTLIVLTGTVLGIALTGRRWAEPAEDAEALPEEEEEDAGVPVVEEALA